MSTIIQDVIDNPSHFWGNLAHPDSCTGFLCLSLLYFALTLIFFQFWVKFAIGIFAQNLLKIFAQKFS